MATRSRAISGRSRTRAATKIVPAKLSPNHPAVLLGVTTGALLVVGLVMILSASSVQSFASYGSSFLFFNKQLLWSLIGLVGFVTFARLDYHRLRGVGYVLFALVVVALMAVLVPGVGTEVGGSSRWISAGPLTFQPSELAKLALILFGADVFSRKDERRLGTLGHTVVPMLPAIGILTILIMLQPDLGTTLLLAAIGFGMLFVAGAPMKYLVPMAASGASLAMLAAFAEPYRRARLLAFTHPWQDPLNTGYQTIQSLIAMGSGSWFGVGLGASRQKWSYVPNAHTDFIFAILGEEMGILGTLAVVGLFAFLVYLGIRIAKQAPDRFGMLLACGVTIWISTQALVNMGAVTGTLPITGVPLPLVSFGGTSLVVSLAAMGILSNVARQGKAPRGRPAQRA
ncbi:MAG TPA: putative lipid II flippase FtsW [Actinomycetota bacterium]